MEPLLYQPEGDPVSHQITVEAIEEDGFGLIFTVRSDGEEIGQVDVDVLGDSYGFISGVGPGEKINNGYLRPASLAIAVCLRETRPSLKQVFDIDNEPIQPAA